MVMTQDSMSAVALAVDAYYSFPHFFVLCPVFGCLSVKAFGVMPELVPLIFPCSANHKRGWGQAPSA